MESILGSLCRCLLPNNGGKMLQAQNSRKEPLVVYVVLKFFIYVDFHAR